MLLGMSVLLRKSLGSHRFQRASLLQSVFDRSQERSQAMRTQGRFSHAASSLFQGLTHCDMNDSFLHAFSRLTRKALYSGVDEFGSRAVGVSVLASGPADFPANPQWIGNPICQTVLSATLSGRMRLVTIARPSIEPRADVTFTLSPWLMPFSLANPSGISMKNSRCN